jgi:hypothetical protein
MESIINAINIKKDKQYTLQKNLKVNLVIYVYHGPNFQINLPSIKQIIGNTGQFNNIYIQTGYGFYSIAKE